MISLVDMRPAWRRPAGAQQRRLPLRHKRLAEIINLAKNLDDPIQHHRLRHSSMAAYLKKLFSHNPLVARKPLIRVMYNVFKLKYSSSLFAVEYSAPKRLRGLLRVNQNPSSSDNLAYIRWWSSVRWASWCQARSRQRRVPKGPGFTPA